MENFPRIKSIVPLSKKRLRVQFENGEIKYYDCRPLLQLPAFEPLRNDAFFKNVRLDKAGYGVIWNDYIDLSEAELWVNGDSESTQ